jgi:hypothetical protein
LAARPTRRWRLRICRKWHLSKLAERALQPLELGSDAERWIDEPHVLDDVAVCQPPDLHFADLVHRLAALMVSRCAIHAAKSQTRHYTLFAEPMILSSKLFKQGLGRQRQPSAPFAFNSAMAGG